MIELNEAKFIAEQYLIKLKDQVGEPLQLVKTQEESFGWVFFYQSKNFVDTGELSSMLAGNAPFIVDRRQGAIHVLGTAEPADVYIQDFLLKNSGAL